MINWNDEQFPWPEIARGGYWLLFGLIFFKTREGCYRGGHDRSGSFQSGGLASTWRIHGLGS
jgi:hypothetical protein